MKLLPQDIFTLFKSKVLDQAYSPDQAIETLQARFTAMSLLQNENPDHVVQAKAFLSKTSMFKEQDLARLSLLASQVSSWDELEICSSYTNTLGDFLEYKLAVTKHDGSRQVMHYHANFEIQDQCCLFTSQTAPLIRITDDLILQSPGILYPTQATQAQRQELSQQVEHAKSVLIQTGGAGIAANQCAKINKPYRFTIVGVFHNILAHAQGVDKRYPGTKFPQAMIMVNPEIIAVSKEKQAFNHACLSVPCANRCAVLSPMSMRVKYQDYLDAMNYKEVTLSGVNAVVLWHELMHIIYGKTYMDVTFEALPLKDLLVFKEMLQNEIQERFVDSYSEIPTLSVPPFHFSVKANTPDSVTLDTVELSKVLPNITTETLMGLVNQARTFIPNVSALSL